MAKPGVDSTGCDWDAVTRSWSQLTPAQQAEAQKKISALGSSKEPFHVRVERIKKEILCQ
jgi:hypothetical protein